ncbi:outer membrane protein assembly factor BamB family protein [Actinomarinicola tropica]|uniref:PQQ-binding-like beta-propeller repeat protein n=1 Tax=Actinomarinicola tropica TaxID=2789776 RepID=A0A5Q2RII1_9ACTN|nr:PQQ-binding-like beta-propeller repeat protein [Actinomarinicola tropica]QGG93650.1 PQQ-binding-like beta-propeller repeat protein [Actinomarinicola tropica]
MPSSPPSSTVVTVRTAALVVAVLAALAVVAASASSTDASTAAPDWPTAEPTGAGDAWVDPASAGHPWGDAVDGLLTFRGNPTRTFHGTGPMPADPVRLWRYPDAPMCSESEVEQGDYSGTFEWCGTGWTGQPAVFEREGRTWVVFGAYDRSIHFLDAADGSEIIPSFETGDIIKGTVTVDPDGYPLVYSGSRDDHMHVVAFDGEAPRELWTFDANSVEGGLWNDDWDASPLVIDDHLIQGGENSFWYVWKLNRGYAPDGSVTVDPELVFTAPGWDDELLDDLGDEQVSIESSIAVSGDVAYFTNSGGLVQGWDLSGLREGRDPERVFRFWMGDDTDATIVVDDEGMLYVASQYERSTARADEVGQIVKLDPSRPDDPVVWSVHDPDRKGVWATPAIHRDVLIVPTDGGRVMALDRATGEERWEMFLRGPTWQSPVVVDDVLVQGDCRGGVLRGFDVRDTSRVPPQLWTVELGGCIESTPAVWDGRIYVGTRGGFVHAVGERTDEPVVVVPGGR